MNRNLTLRFTFLLTIIIFFIFKYEALKLPYYWDELGVYSQASLYMYDHAPSLLPGDIPDVLSRGHPLLFMFIYGCFFKVFGTSILATHIFTFLISLAFVTVSYKIAEKFFSADIALISSSLLIVQPLFFAQSVFVLPEIMLGVFALLSIYFYLDKKLWASSIFATLSLLTKETAIVLPIVFTLMECISHYKKKTDNKQLFKNLLIIFLPYYIFGIFIVIQRIQNGWFFYPYHTGFISFNLENIYWRLIGYLRFVFGAQGRLTWLMVIIISLVYVWYKNKRKTVELLKTTWTNYTPSTFVITTLIFYALGILGYSSLNYPLQRYILLIYPVFTLFITLMVYHLLKQNKIQTYGVFAVLIIINLFFMTGKKRNVENDMGYKDLLEIQIDICKYFDQEAFYKKTIAADFPITPGFYDTRLGYVNKARLDIKEIGNTIDPSVEYYIYTLPGNIEEKKVPAQLRLIKTFKKGLAEGYIYTTTP